MEWGFSGTCSDPGAGGPGARDQRMGGRCNHRRFRVAASYRAARHGDRADDRVAGGPGRRPAHVQHASAPSLQPLQWDYTCSHAARTLIGRDCDARILLVVLRPGPGVRHHRASQAATRAEALAAIERNARAAHSDAVLVMHHRETLLELKPAAAARSPRAD